MEKYDPYNPNNLDDIFKEAKKEKKEIKEINNKENNIMKEGIGMNILKKMGWKGKGIKTIFL